MDRMLSTLTVVVVVVVVVPSSYKDTKSG